MYAPKLSAVAMAVEVPLSATVAPLPPADGVIAPETVKVCAGGGGILPLGLAPVPAHPPEKAAVRRVAIGKRANRTLLRQCRWPNCTRARLPNGRTIIVWAPPGSLRA